MIRVQEGEFKKHERNKVNEKDDSQTGGKANKSRSRSNSLELMVQDVFEEDEEDKGHTLFTRGHRNQGSLKHFI